MRKMTKRTLSGSVIAVALGIGAVLGIAAPASAFSQLEMTQACRVQYGQLGWEAQLTYPNQGVYGWRCFYNNAPWASWYNEKKSLNVQLYCNAVYGGTARFSSQSNAYSWYCG
ncbi:hypothetical protein [Pseudolysinimonas sp.]|jgi:hypothetical protein|uniref:hypothetical protein n=1 Tax=Pseudolysinimonas sp. TaxID=2680009 RepID=UPI0037833470